MSKETDRVMGHADEADGIEEYDNPLPDWWLGLFWACILWAVGYTVYYHFIADRSQEERFEAEMAAASVRWPASSAAEAEFALTSEAIQAGETVYTTYCFVCHGQNLEGGIGPSFLDDEWLHGGDPLSVIHTIIEGVPEKGMAPWGPILGADEINHVAAFILSKHAEAMGIPLDSVAQGSGGSADSAAAEDEGAGGDPGDGSGGIPH